MENNIMVIDGVNCYTKDGTAYLKLDDVARGLGFTDNSKGSEYVRWNTVRLYLKEIGFSQEVAKNDFIPENVFYRLAMKAKNEVAEKFQAKVADEILPSIRKHGAYMTSEVIEQALTSPDFLIKLATQLKEEKAARLIAEQTIEKQKPLVNFATKVAKTSDLIDMGKMAKLLHDENIPIGRNKLFEWLRDQKILMSNNVPYQKYIQEKYFEIKENIKETPYGVKVFTTTFVTGKGQIYITEKLRKLYEKKAS